MEQQRLMGFEVGDETPKAEAGLVLLHPFNQNQKAQNARWDLVGKKWGKSKLPPKISISCENIWWGNVSKKGGDPLFVSIR